MRFIDLFIECHNTNQIASYFRNKIYLKGVVVVLLMYTMQLGCQPLWLIETEAYCPSNTFKFSSWKLLLNPLIMSLYIPVLCTNKMALQCWTCMENTDKTTHSDCWMWASDVERRRRARHKHILPPPPTNQPLFASCFCKESHPTTQLIIG